MSALAARMKTTSIAIGGFLLLSVMGLSTPATAQLLCLPDIVPTLGSGSPNACDEEGYPECETGPNESTDTDSSRTTTCKDGYSCTVHSHYNDPTRPSYTEYIPPGCEDDPRFDS